VASGLKDLTGQPLLAKLAGLWEKHTILVFWMQRGFMYLDRFYTKNSENDALFKAGLGEFQKSVYNNEAGALAGQSCDMKTQPATGACITKAPNFQWASGLTGGFNTSSNWANIDPAASAWDTRKWQPAGDMQVGTSATSPGAGFFKIENINVWYKPSYVTIGAKRAQLVDDPTVTRQVGYDASVTDGLSVDSLRCMGIDAMDRDFSTYDDVDNTDECYGVFSVNENKDLYNVRCGTMGSNG
jgi:hypothetical protein